MPNKLHLLTLSSWYPEDADSRNGIFILQQMEALAERGDVQVGLLAGIAQKQMGIDSIEKEKNGVHHCIGRYPMGMWPPRQGLRYFLAMRRAWRQYIQTQGKPDMLMVQVVWKAGWIALWLHYRYNIPYVVMEHWSGYLPAADGYHGFWRKYITKLVVERAERVCTVSETLQKGMQAKMLENRYSVVPNVVDTAIFLPNQGARSDQPVFLHVSNLAAVKRFDLILAAFAVFRASHPTSVLHVAGAFVQEQAKRSFTGPWEGVVLHGVMDQKALADLYRMSHALLLPSRYETFSIVVPEALACGCAVISTDLPAIRVHADLAPIQFVAEDSPQAWCEAMQDFWQRRSTAQQDAHAAVEARYGKVAVAKTLHQVLIKAVHAP